MNQSIQIIYEDFEVSGADINGRITINKSLKVATIPFSERTTPYVNSESYADNVESMVYDIMQNGFFYVNGNSMIPILNVKKFLFNDQVKVNEPPKQQTQQEAKRNWPRKFDRGNKKRQILVDTSQIKPVKPEEVLPEVAVTPKAEAIGPVEPPKFKMSVEIQPPVSMPPTETGTTFEPQERKS